MAILPHDNVEEVDERRRGHQGAQVAKIDSGQEGVCVPGILKDPKEPRHCLPTGRNSTSASKESSKAPALKEGSTTEFKGSHDGKQIIVENARNNSGERKGSGKGNHQLGKPCRGNSKKARCFQCNSLPQKGEEFVSVLMD